MKKTNIEGMVYMRLILERKKEIEQKAEKFRQGMDNEIIDTIILARAKGFEVSSATFHEENVDGGIIIRKVYLKIALMITNKDLLLHTNSDILHYIMMKTE